MCVIVHSIYGKESLDYETLVNCWEANPDGAGLVYREGNTLTVIKGLMTLERLLEAFETVPESAELALHFRISTHGGVNPWLTHPFPIGGKLETLGRLKWIRTTKPFLLHNGQLLINTPDWLSDTAKKAKNLPKSLEISKIVKKLKKFVKGNRFLVVHPAAEWVRLGDWHKEKEGLYFSNLSWKVSRWVWGYRWGESDVETLAWEYGLTAERVKRPPKRMTVLGVVEGLAVYKANGKFYVKEQGRSVFYKLSGDRDALALLEKDALGEWTWNL